VLTAINFGFNNWSLVYISLTLNQLLKSLVPLPTAVLSMIFESKKFSWVVWVSMIVVVIGTMMAAYGDVKFQLGGAALCAISLLASAAWNVCSAMLLQLGGDKMSAVDLVFYSSPWSVLFTAALFCVAELPRMVDSSEHAVSNRMGGGLFFIILLCAGLLGFSYDLIHNQFIKLTSSMTMAIMGNTKLILLIIISLLFLEDKKEADAKLAVNICGIVIGVCGCIWYSYSRLTENKKPKEEKQATGQLSEPLAKTKAVTSEDSRLLADAEVGSKGCFGCC